MPGKRPLETGLESQGGSGFLSQVAQLSEVEAASVGEELWLV